MMREVLKSSLPELARRLIEEMQRIQFGCIEDLRIRAGLPVFEPRPRILLDRKIGFSLGPGPSEHGPDFKIKSEVVELLRLLSDLGDGVVVSLEIRHGLPMRVRMEKRD